VLNATCEFAVSLSANIERIAGASCRFPGDLRLPWAEPSARWTAFDLAALLRAVWPYSDLSMRVKLVSRNSSAEGSAMRTLPVMIATLFLVGSCASNESSSSVTSASESATAQSQPSTTEGPAEDVFDVVILSDSLSLGGWPQTWAGLIEDELGVPVEVHDLSVMGKADYDVVLQQSNVRQTLQGAEIVFIAPDPDYLRDACPPGTSDPDCVAEFSVEYRTHWAGWLDDIGTLTNGAILRSAEAWVWLAPSDRRSGLIEFMDQMASETIEHGGLIADINTALTGADHTMDPPPGSIDSGGHLFGPGADKMAELLDRLGYAAPT
jgi:hypothetical protein